MQEQIFFIFYCSICDVWSSKWFYESAAYKRADPEFNSTNQHQVRVSVHLLNHT